MSSKVYKFDFYDTIGDITSPEVGILYLVGSNPYSPYVYNGSALIPFAGGGGSPSASSVTYDNTDSGLTASNVQDAIDEVVSGKQDTLTAGSNITIDANNEISATDTTYESKAAASGGTAESLCTTGEKYIWNEKQDSLQQGSLSNVNVDNVKTAGSYWVTNTSVTGLPSEVTNTFGYLIVIQSSASIYEQIYIQYGSDNSDAQHRVYVRGFSNGQWYEWTRMLRKQDIDFESNYNMRSPNNSTVATSTSVVTDSFTLKKGLYQICMAVRFEDNSTGIRRVMLVNEGSTNQVAGSSIYLTRLVKNASSANETTCLLSFYINLTSSSQKYDVNVWQNSGSSLTAYTRVQILKLADITK